MRPSSILIALMSLSLVASCSSKGDASSDTAVPEETLDLSYPIVDTRQSSCYNDSSSQTCPSEGAAFYGQDAQFQGYQPSFSANGDGTVTDRITGLIWVQTPDTTGDGSIEAIDKLTSEEALAYCDDLVLAGQSDWRLPSIKELYSLMDFRGEDPSGVKGDDTSGLTPFIDTEYFDFAYGDTSAGERIIDAQYASSTLYVGTGTEKLFGVNFADGRIKGYDSTMPGGMEKTYSVQCVRGLTYGVNELADLGDGTIEDAATGLVWSQDDSGEAMNWEEALAWVQAKNAESWLGHDDWRLPNAKELQSIVDYTRSPDSSDSAAIDPLFNATSITNEAGETDWPFYWTGTTHASSNGMGANTVYLCFGRGLGYMEGAWTDVHGAGAQRSDPKTGDPADYPTGNGPQGDAIRIYNYVRLVRGGSDGDPTDDDTGSDDTGTDDTGDDDTGSDDTGTDSGDTSYAGQVTMVDETLGADFCDGDVALTAGDDGVLSGNGDCTISAGPGAGMVIGLDFDGTVPAGSVTMSMDTSSEDITASTTGVLTDDVVRLSWTFELSAPMGATSTIRAEVVAR